MIPAASHNGIGLLPWSPLAGGFLTGKYQRSGKATADTRAGSEKLSINQFPRSMRTPTATGTPSILSFALRKRLACRLRRSL